MKYRVELTRNGQAEADAAYVWLAARTMHAGAWFNGLVDAIEGLVEFPARWPKAPESAEFAEPVRQLLYGTAPHVYRVLFIVRGHVVYVLHVRHGALPALKAGEMTLPPAAARHGGESGG